MEIDEKKSSNFARRVLRIGFIYLIGFTLFFVASLIIITVNVKTRQKVKVPELVGKMYLEEHNNLLSLGLQVDLKKVNLTEYPYGIIMAQNISPGKIVKEGSLFVITVNESKTLVPVPSLVGVSEAIAKKMIEVIPVGKTTFSLIPGVVTTIPHSSPKGEVLAQYPPAATPVLPDTPVMMLISEGPDKLKTGFFIPDLKKSNVEIIKKISYEFQIPVKIVPVPTYDYWKNGEVEKVSFGKPGSFYMDKNLTKQSWDVYVNQYVPTEHISYPNHLRWVEIQEPKLEGSQVTVYEKPRDAQYGNPAYAVLGKVWPVFYSSEVKLEVWNGYQEQTKILFEDLLKTRISPDFQKKVSGIKI